MKRVRQGNRDPEGTYVWDAPRLPGRAGSGLIGCVGFALVQVAVAVAMCLWLIGGMVATVAAVLIACAWVVFTMIAIWQVIEMRRAGGYTRIPPPGMNFGEPPDDLDEPD